ncbi:T9SS type A sorting domain-containing protein [bacterium]|nr:T9SS type A sorting domain-containing protein [bacterium]
MKRYIYIIVFVFATLFCQAFGAQNEPPTILDTTICATPGATVHMSDFKPRILELLQNREDSIWSECCDVTVELEREPQIAIESKLSTGWPDLNIDKNKVVGMTVTYKRQLTCTNLPRSKEDAKSKTSLAMWHLFGKLLSETETGKATKISDVATVTTLHKATFFYGFELALPDTGIVPFKILGERCFDEEGEVELSVGSAYFPYNLNWIVSDGIGPSKASSTSELFYERHNKGYLYPIICTVTACKGESRSDTIFIGKPTPTPEIDDLGCIAANDTSFEVNVNNPNPQLFYHWSVEDLGNGSIIDTQQGALVTMQIPQNESVRLKLVSTGGCKASDAVTQELHRSVVAGNIQLQGDTNCVFIGDTLRLSLSETPEDTLVWQIAGIATMLPPHNTYAYPAVQAKDNVVVSVYAKACPNNIITDTFNIREDFRVSLGTSPMCISANEYQVIKLTSNGINPEVHWYGNGVEIDSTTYKKEDSIRLRLTNPGDQNLYVKVTAKECGRERDTLLVLRPKPEMPSLDPLWGMLTPCIPLGIDTTIELRVQPQEGVKFRWSIMEEEITELDSNSIPFRVNYKLPDRNTPIPVSVYAYTEGCHNGSEPFSTTLYATGAGLDEEWDLLQVPFELSFLGSSIIVGYNISFSDDGMEKEDDPFEGRYIYYWYSNDIDIVESDRDVYAYFVDIPENDTVRLFCRLTNEEKQCYSVYSINVIDMADQQDVLFTAMKGEDAVNSKGTEVLQAQVSFEKEDMPCPGIVLKPNPVHSGTQVKVEGICETESFIVECYSPQGRLMFRTTAKGDTFTLPTDNYAAGVYIVKIQLNGAAAPVVKKLIIL